MLQRSLGRSKPLPTVGRGSDLLSLPLFPYFTHPNARSRTNLLNPIAVPPHRIIICM